MVKFSKVIGRRDLPKNHYCEIGQMIVEWCWLEYRMQESIWHLLRLNKKEGRILTAELPPSELAIMLRALAPRLVSDTTLSDQIVAVTKKVENAAKHRNNLAHGFWAFNSAMPEPVLYRYTGATRTWGKTPDYSPPEIEKTTASIRGLRTDLEDLLARV